MYKCGRCAHSHTCVRNEGRMGNLKRSPAPRPAALPGASLTGSSPPLLRPLLAPVMVPHYPCRGPSSTLSRPFLTPVAVPPHPCLGPSSPLSRSLLTPVAACASGAALGPSSPWPPSSRPLQAALCPGQLPPRLNCPQTSPMLRAPPRGHSLSPCPEPSVPRVTSWGARGPWPEPPGRVPRVGPVGACRSAVAAPAEG